MRRLLPSYHGRNDAWKTGFFSQHRCILEIASTRVFGKEIHSTMDATASGSPPVAMLPADQVAAMIEQMKLEQARLLKEQQQVIVQQVMKGLIEAGLTTPADSQVMKKGSKRRQQSPSRLEQNLHSLVLHSLDERGLDYPHVQRCAYSATPVQQSHDLRGTRPAATRTVSSNSKTVVVSRCETEPFDTEDPSPATDDAQRSGEQYGGEVSAQHGRIAEREGQRHKRVDALRASPLQSAQGPTRLKKSRNNRRRGREKVHTDSNEDEEFNAVRSRVGHRTLAILDRSRALLEETKLLQSGQRQRNGAKGETTFVDRMRQKLIQADAFDGDDASGGAEESEPSRKEADEPRDQPSAPSVESDKQVEDESHEPHEHSASRPSSSNTDRPVGSNSVQPVSVTCEDIEILRPPAHSPENEHEWENELARQILTIYATSVKAKAANRPSSRPGSRQVDSAGNLPNGSRLGTSCSLPVIGKPKPVPSSGSAKTIGSQQTQSPSRAVVHYSWEPSQRLQDGKVVVNMPKVPKPIWFAGTGAVKAVWCALAEGFQGLQASPSKAKVRTGTVAVCEHQLCEEIRRLEAKQQYSQCITTLETLLISLVRARGVDTLETKLWKQLVVMCNAFASRCVDYKKFPAALKLIKQAEHLLHNSILVDDGMRFELLAYLYDTYAHYYYKRGKSHAGLQYMFKAHEIHTRQSSWAHLAKCRLHIANLLSAQSKHQDAMKYMASILEMIEDNKLEEADGDRGAGSEGSASAQKICLAAVCYNNLAIEQLHLREFEAANVSTGNAKRLAKLCLSYSNRWLAQFDATGNCVDLAIATLMEDVNAASNAAYKAT